MNYIDCLVFLFVEDNLQQLKSIQDQIQKMRIENQKQATADQPYPTSSRPGHINIGLLSTQRDPYAAARLSISCPSLNNSLSAMGKEGVYANPMNENNNYDGHECAFDMNSNYNNSQSSNGQNSNTPGHSSRRRKNNDPNNPSATNQLAVPSSKGHRKRQGHQRHRR